MPERVERLVQRKWTLTRRWGYDSESGHCKTIFEWDAVLFPISCNPAGTPR